MFGEKLQQHGMRGLAIQNDNAFDAPADRFDAGFHLGDHAAGNGAVLDERLRIGNGQFLDEVLVLVQHARNIGQEQEARCGERPGNRACKRVGVDIVGMAVATRCDRCNDRDHFGAR